MAIELDDHVAMILGEPIGFEDIRKGRSIIADYCDLSQMLSNDIRDIHWTLLENLQLPHEEAMENGK